MVKSACEALGIARSSYYASRKRQTTEKAVRKVKEKDAEIIEKIRELYRQTDREEALKILDNIIFNLKLADDAELVRWGNTLKKWRKPVLNYFHNRTTNGYTKML
ncbi:MAG TPA: transposase [Candidatus Atribacteria bacterium]|nr:transposase [Candidatus Atribacteria bacterium]